MKLLVETTGSFMVHLAVAEQTVEADRPGVVRQSAFINRLTAEGRLRVLHQLADTATDAGFVETLQGAEGDVELAVAAFASEHPYDTEAVAAEKEAAAAKEPAKKSRAKADN